MRRGEALALSWDHIDLDAGVLKVEATLAASASGWSSANHLRAHLRHRGPRRIDGLGEPLGL
jgi:integrase